MRACPVSALVAVTVTPGTTAPVESVTVPFSAPVPAVWAIVAGLKAAKAKRRTSTPHPTARIVLDIAHPLEAFETNFRWFTTPWQELSSCNLSFSRDMGGKPVFVRRIRCGEQRRAAKREGSIEAEEGAREAKPLTEKQWHGLPGPPPTSKPGKDSRQFWPALCPRRLTWWLCDERSNGTGGPGTGIPSCRKRGRS